MPVQTSYPGIYIEELPSSARTITPAPTSVTVFVGYTHPFKTQKPLEAKQVFSFTEYERAFGGHFRSGAISSAVPIAVEQFFLNGGSVAYVVGLQPKVAGVPLAGATGTISSIVFTARELTDDIPIKVAIANVRQTTSADDTADITISYGRSVETFRGVNLIPGDPGFIATRFGTPTEPASALVTIAPSGTYPTAFTKSETTLSGAVGSTFDAADFTPVFAAESSLDKVEIFNILAIPGVADNAVWTLALAFCERKRAFMILDAPAEAAADSNSTFPILQKLGITSGSPIIPPSANAALYFPYLKGRDPIQSDAIEIAPSGFVAGIFARTDQNRGVWKAPAGLEATLKGTTGVVDRGRMTDMQQGVLNPKGVNCIRTSSLGSVVFGARTVVTENPAYQPWKYVPVRRTALFIEQTLYRELTWAIFEPNDEPLWLALRTTVENFMLSLFTQGAFQGGKPSEAFIVTCDSTTTTQTDIDNGTVNILVGFRPLKPAEFVVVKIAQLAGQVQA